MRGTVAVRITAAATTAATTSTPTMLTHQMIRRRRVLHDARIEARVQKVHHQVQRRPPDGFAHSILNGISWSYSSINLSELCVPKRGSRVKNRIGIEHLA